MKKLYVLSAFLLLFRFSDAQYISVTMLEDSVKIGAPNPSVEIVIHAEVTNLTANTVNVACERISHNLAPNWQSYYCLVDCQPPTVDNSVAVLAPGMVTELTYHFVVSSVEDSSDARMQLRIQGQNGTQYWYKTFKGVTDAGFVSAAAAFNTTPAVKAFPSPVISGQAMTFTVENITGTAQLTVTDLNGKTLSTHEISNGNFELNTSGMAAGLYLWTVSGEGVNPASGKFSVIE